MGPGIGKKSALMGISIEAVIGAMLIVFLFTSGCSNPLDFVKEKIVRDQAEAGDSLSDSKDITAFSFLDTDNAALSADVAATITDTNISATVPFGTAVTGLVASFSMTGTSVTVGSTTQASRVTTNNFTNPVTYRVTAEDSSYKDYTVTVTVALPTAKDITSFSFLDADNATLSADVTATITGTNISATVPYVTDVTALVASFGTTGISVKVGGTTQVSGETANNFTNPVTYRVTAEDSSFQDYTVTVEVSAILAPDGVLATAGDSQITISWNPVSGATSYNLYWSTSSGVTKSTGTQIVGVSSPYSHTGLSNGTPYYYVVTAVTPDDESPESAEVSATPQPPAPTGVAVAAGDQQLTVIWGPVSGASGYNLYWSTSSGVTKSTGTQIAGVASPFIHSGLTNYTTYYYVVTTVKGNESAESAEASAIPQAPWSTVAAGESHSLGIRTDGTLWAWGKGSNGQLGLGDELDRNVPVRVGTATNWIAVSGGMEHSLGMRSDGTLWAWGWNSSGQLGLGDTFDRSTPTQVGSATVWNGVAAGRYHSFAIRTDGTLWAWGRNIDNQLGLGDTIDRAMPTQVGSATNWNSVAGGEGHSIAVRSDGTLWAWGNNSYGELGLGDTTDRTAPTQVVGATNWSTVSARHNHSLGLRSDGTLWAWGSNSRGQLGLGDLLKRTAPTQVDSATNWNAISAGIYYSLARRVSSALFAWGTNDQGQLGLGDTDDRLTPVQVDYSWAAVIAGGSHSIGLNSDTTLWGWGDNNRGQLGLGDFTDRTEPTEEP